jgi:hypothetical protein
MQKAGTTPTIGLQPDANRVLLNTCGLPKKSDVSSFLEAWYEEGHIFKDRSRHLRLVHKQLFQSSLSHPLESPFSQRSWEA